MIYQSHKISPEMSKYLTAIHYHKDYYTDHEMDKYLPDGSMNLIFELSGTPKFIYDNVTQKKKEKFRDTWFSGVHTDFITISSNSEEMLVVVFKPGAGFPLLHKPIHLYSNKVIQAEKLFGESICVLHRQLKGSTSPQKKFVLIGRMVIRSIKRR